MSKNALRYPESAIGGGRFGTARVRSALTPGLPAAVPVPRPVVTPKPSAASPLQRMQALGRLGIGAMNKTEAAYALLLDAERAAGKILWYRFEGIKLRLADNTFLTVDFAVITSAGELEFREVKGRWLDDARAKIKVAAQQYPFRFIAIHRDGRHGWRMEDLTCKAW